MSHNNDPEWRTPRNRIYQSLRKLWLMSKERQTALKRDKYTCQHCKRKQSVAKGKEFKVQVHHIKGIMNWEKIISEIYDELLPSPDQLVTVCRECHLELERQKQP